MTNSKRYKILIVDDEPLNIQFLETLMSDQFDVIFDTNGENALAIVKSGNPDLIVLDIMMPGLDGYEVCRRLKADPETQFIPVIFITAKEGEEDEARGLELGAVDYITKPFNPEIVKRKITNHIQQITARPRQSMPRQQQGDHRRQSGRRASDKRSLASWLTVAIVLVALIAGGIVALQLDLIPWPAATSKVDQTAGVSTTAAPSAPTAAATTTKSPSGAENSRPAADTALARRLASLEWLEKTTCPEVPEVEWWRFVSHRSIARYVTRNLKGDWQGYLDKWTTRLKNVEDIYERNSTAVTGTGVKLSGDDLADYVAKMKIRVAAIECLSQEAAAFIKAVEKQ